MAQSSPALLHSLSFVAASAAGTLAIAWPAPVEPREMPALVLERRETDAVAKTDSANAARLSANEITSNIEALLRENNLAEVRGPENGNTQGLRAANLRALSTDLEREGGEAALTALRAKAVVAFERAISSAPLERHAELVGSLPRVTERYGITRAGVLVAPAFVLRTLFKARWNHLIGKAPTWRLAPVEVRAYYGWLITGAEGAVLSDRIRAFSDYVEAGGTREGEIAGILYSQSGQNESAKEAFLRALDAHFDFRLRNYTLSVPIDAEE
jgi:hypothetical protein